MDFRSFSRKELQALCKEKGIPANKTNAFMADALAALQRSPLSPIVVNKGERKVRLKESTQPAAAAKENDRLADRTLKIPAAAKRATSSFTGYPPNKDFEEKAVKSEKVEFAATRPVFANNFLSRGKRKDPPASQEREVQEKVKVQRNQCPSFGKPLSEQTVLNTLKIAEAPVAGVEKPKAEPASDVEKVTAAEKTKAEAAVAPVKIEKAAALQNLKPKPDLSTAAEARIDLIGQSELKGAATAAQVRIDLNSKSEEHQDLITFPEEHQDLISFTEARIVSDSSEKSLEAREGRVESINLDFSFPVCPERDVKVTGDSLFAMIPRHCSATEGLDSPSPIRLSPLRRMEERVLRMVERVTSFSWKWPASDLAEVSAGS